MGFSDRKKVLPQETGAGETSLEKGVSTPIEKNANEKIKFERLIQSYESSKDLSKKARIPLLRELQKTLKTEEDGEKVQEILRNIVGAPNEAALKKYFAELDALKQKKEGAQTQVIDGAKQGEAEVKVEISKTPAKETPTSPVGETIQDTAQKMVFGSEEYQSIKDIEINRSFDNAVAFQAHIEKFIESLETNASFLSLAPEAKTKLQNYLREAGKKLAATEKVQGDFLNAKFNTLASQIEHQNEGKVQLTLEEGQSIEFSSKKAAFDFIKELKNEAEWEFQGVFRTLAEETWSLMTGLTSQFFSRILIKPYEITWNAGKNVIEDSFNDSSWLWYGLEAVILAIASVGTLNYTETLWRRVVLDILAKVGVKSIPSILKKTEEKDGKKVKVRDQNKLRLGNYSIERGEVIFSEAESAERNEYVQRMRALSVLKEQSFGMLGKDRKAFDQELARVKSFLNVNTNTFWLKAYALSTDKTLFGRTFDIFRHGYINIGGNIIDKATAHFNNGQNFQDDIERGSNYLFDDAKIEKNEKGNIIGVSGTESKGILQIKDSIKARNDISEKEKQRIIGRVDAFMKDFKSHPHGILYVKEQILSIVKYGYLDKTDIKAALEKKYPFLKKEDQKKVTTWFADTLSDFQHGTEKWKAQVKAPLFTSGENMVYKFMSIVEAGNWEGNQADLEDVFKKIDAGKWELNQIYPGFGKIRFVFDSLLGSLSKYGVQTPELTKLHKFADNLSDDALKDILEKGQEYGKSKDKIKKVVSEGIDIEGKRYTPVVAIKNYIHYILGNNDERKYRKILEAFLKEVESGNNLYSENEFFREISRIQSGFLPSHHILQELEKLKEEKTKSFEKAKKTDTPLMSEEDFKNWELNIKSFMESARKGNLNFTDTGIKALKEGTLSFERDGAYISSEFTDEIKKEFIKNLEKLEGIDAFDFGKQLGEPKDVLGFEKALAERFKDELVYLKLLAKAQKSENAYPANLKLFAASISEHAYTRGQAKIVLEKIFERENFRSIDIEGIIRDTADHQSEIGKKQNLKNTVSDIFSKLSEIDKAGFLNFVRDNSIDSAILPQNMKDALEKVSKAGEIREKTAAQVAEIERLRDEIKVEKNPATLKELEKELNLYIQKQGINRKSSSFQTLLQEIKNYTQIPPNTGEESKITAPERETKNSTLTESQKTLQKECYSYAERAEKEISLSKKDYVYDLSVVKKEIKKLIKAGKDAGEIKTFIGTEMAKDDITKEVRTDGDLTLALAEKLKGEDLGNSQKLVSLNALRDAVLRRETISSAQSKDLWNVGKIKLKL